MTHDIDINKELRLSAKNGSFEDVKHWLNQGADVHSQDDLSLRYAVYNNDVQTTRLLLDLGADVEALGHTALQTASREGYTDILELLLGRGAGDAQKPLNDALLLATYSNHIEIVKTLLTHGADAEYSSQSPLIAAIFQKNKDIAELLMQHGANPKKIEQTFPVHYEEFLEQTKLLRKKTQDEHIKLKQRAIRRHTRRP